MATQKQIDANQRNAQKSTGPRTDAGKQSAAINGLKHGMYTTRPLLPGQSGSELAASYRASLRPSGPMEEFFVKRIVSLQWQLRRIAAAEEQLFARERAQATGFGCAEVEEADADCAIEAGVFVDSLARDATRGEVFFRLSQDQTRLQRSNCRDHDKLSVLNVGGTRWSCSYDGDRLRRASHEPASLTKLIWDGTHYVGEYRSWR